MRFMQEIETMQKTDGVETFKVCCSVFPAMCLFLYAWTYVYVCGYIRTHKTTFFAVYFTKY